MKKIKILADRDVRNIQQTNVNAIYGPSYASPNHEDSESSAADKSEESDEKRSPYTWYGWYGRKPSPKKNAYKNSSPDNSLLGDDRDDDENSYHRLKKQFEADIEKAEADSIIARKGLKQAQALYLAKERRPDKSKQKLAQHDGQNLSMKESIRVLYERMRAQEERIKSLEEENIRLKKDGNRLKRKLAEDFLRKEDVDSVYEGVCEEVMGKLEDIINEKTGEIDDWLKAIADTDNKAELALSDVEAIAEQFVDLLDVDLSCDAFMSIIREQKQSKERVRAANLRQLLTTIGENAPLAKTVRFVEPQPQSQVESDSGRDSGKENRDPVPRRSKTRCRGRGRAGLCNYSGESSDDDDEKQTPTSNTWGTAIPQRSRRR